jgi:tetratricopeptide (TPR) repeat protein
LAGSIVVLAALAVYHNSFSGPFVLDDTWSITTNPSIQHLGSALSPPPDKGTGGRPLLNLMFALNYAWGGFGVYGYHAVNLLIHTLAGLTLFGIVRRTLLRVATAQSELSECGRGAPPTVDSATVLALAVAVIWVVHPLQTEAVTYISQRAESLMGLFYLLTLYCFIRSAENQKPEAGGQRPDASIQKRSSLRHPSSGIWLLGSVFFCLLGATTKETIATAPVMVFLYDRTFIAGSFREAWRSRWRYYLGLACAWLLLVHSIISLGQRSVGFGQGVTWWSYALTSCRSVVLYLKLAVWPHPLVFDYGASFIQQATEALPYALVLVALLAAVAIALWRRPVIGFAGAWFFVILAPTSSVVPVADQPTAEHRMYLSLAAVIALVVVGLYRLMGRRGLIVCAAAAVGLGWLSVERNNEYRSPLVLWSDTVAERPDNARARYNLGNVLHDIPGRLPDAVAQFEAAVRDHPESALAHYNLANDLYEAGRVPEALAQYEEALRIDPNDAEAHNNLGSALLISRPGQLTEAMGHFEKALGISPNYADAHYNFGIALDRAGRKSEAIAQYEEALRLKPDYAAARAALAQLQAQPTAR